MPDTSGSCPCGSGRDYSDCCKLYHTGSAVPDTAEALMRSRYAAYVAHEISYLVETHDPTRRNEFDRLSAAKWAQDADWKRLDILSRKKGKPEDETGQVEFIAWFEMSGELACHFELSDFRKAEGRWVYVDGVSRSRKAAFAKLSRNAPCPCGSGRVVKRCHGA